MIDRVKPPRPAALLYFFDGARAYFKEQAVKTPIFFGFNERARQVLQGVGDQSRIVLVPGKLKDGGDGAFGPVIGPGGNPRKLFTQGKVATASLFVGSRMSPDERDEAAMIGALDELLEQFLSAIQEVLQQNVTLSSANYNANPLETKFGLEYLVEFSISGTYRALEQGIPTSGVTPAIHRGSETIPPNPT